MVIERRLFENWVLGHYGEVGLLSEGPLQRGCPFVRGAILERLAFLRAAIIERLFNIIIIEV